MASQNEETKGENACRGKSEGVWLCCLLACHDKCELAKTSPLLLDCLFLPLSFGSRIRVTNTNNLHLDVNSMKGTKTQNTNL